MATSTLIIEEITGKKRRITLEGAGLPFQGANWGGVLQVATQWNPGNAEATQHVLSAQEAPSSWEGFWNTTRLISAPPKVRDEGGDEIEVVRADTLALFVEDVFRGGQLLRVQWLGDEFRRKSRVGRATTWDFKYIRFDDVRWTAEFTWTGRGEPRPSVATFRGESVLAASRRAILALTDASSETVAATIRSQNPLVPESAGTFSLGTLESMVNAPLAFVDSFARAANSISNRMKKIGELVIAGRDLPYALVGRMLDVANNAVAVANQFVDELGRESYEAQVNRTKVSILTQNAAYLGRSQDNAQRAAAASIDLALAIRRQHSALLQSTAGSTSNRQQQASPSDLVAVHIPRQGETMDSIALKFYGEELGAELARANGLPGYTVTPPRIPLMIPTKDVLTKSRLKAV